MRRIVLAIALLTTPANAIETGPAPEGSAFDVAKKIIWENFDRADCTKVTVAVLEGDGTIRALCSNKETYRVFTVPQAGDRAFAMKCSVVNFVAGKTVC